MKRLLFSGFVLSFVAVLPADSIAGENAATSNAAFALVIHGGAGVLSKKEMTPESESAYRAVLEQSLRAGYAVLQTNGTSTDAVVAAIQVMEDSPLFNAGRGAVLNSEGQVELDAAIMEGAGRKAGSVAAVKHLKNPIMTARLVMEKSPHVLLVGDGAEKFAKEQGIELVPQDYFITEARVKQLEQILREKQSQNKPRSDLPKRPGTDRFGTVGAVALDRQGNLAAGTSTGGLAGKLPGRVGDSPIIGAGTYANNATCAVSATGHGEFFIRSVVAYDIASLMDYKRLTVAEAAKEVVRKKLVAFGGEGGVIAIDGKGHIALPFNSEGMYRGYVREDGKPAVFIYEE